MLLLSFSALSLFLYNDTATSDISTLSLHDALPILRLADRHRRGHVLVGDRVAGAGRGRRGGVVVVGADRDGVVDGGEDRRSTRLNSSHTVISYAVFCLKKKKRIISDI